MKQPRVIPGPCGSVVFGLALGLGALLPGKAWTQDPLLDRPGPEEYQDGELGGVLEAHAALVAALETGDEDAFVSLLEDSNDLLLFHPILENRFDGVEDARAGIRRMFARIGESTWTEGHPMVRVRGDVAWLTSHLVVESSAWPEPFVGRGTEVWVRGAEGWKLIHAHWSQHRQAEWRVMGQEDEDPGDPR